ncbi:MAG: hypothetical protein CM15mP92_2320 [Halieaceae bacterium]|nr:MAG: hypothetical protein CM15mP92_2320 [Halieaceae bacterium]
MHPGVHLRLDAERKVNVREWRGKSAEIDAGKRGPGRAGAVAPPKSGLRKSSWMARIWETNLSAGSTESREKNDGAPDRARDGFDHGHPVRAYRQRRQIWQILMHRRERGETMPATIVETNTKKFKGKISTQSLEHRKRDETPATGGCGRLSGTMSPGFGAERHVPDDRQSGRQDGGWSVGSFIHGLKRPTRHHRRG